MPEILVWGTGADMAFCNGLDMGFVQRHIAERENQPWIDFLAETSGYTSVPTSKIVELMGAGAALRQVLTPNPFTFLDVKEGGEIVRITGRSTAHMVGAWEAPKGKRFDGRDTPYDGFTPRFRVLLELYGQIDYP